MPLIWSDRVSSSLCVLCIILFEVFFAVEGLFVVPMVSRSSELAYLPFVISVSQHQHGDRGMVMTPCFSTNESKS